MDDDAPRTSDRADVSPIRGVSSVPSVGAVSSMTSSMPGVDAEEKELGTPPTVRRRFVNRSEDDDNGDNGKKKNAARMDDDWVATTPPPKTFEVRRVKTTGWVRPGSPELREPVGESPERENGGGRNGEAERGTGEWSVEARQMSNGMTSVWNYCALELGIRVGEREDDPDMSHARERVFDLLWYIPLELEKFCLYGGLLCADAILGLFTSLPVRVLSQTVRLVVSVATFKSKASSSKRRAWGIHPYAREHLNDVLWLFMLAVAVTYTHMLDVSVIYHYIRGQETIKLYMACHVLETFDKLLCSFNSNVLDALQNSVHGCVSAATNGAKVDQITSVFRLAVDVMLSTCATVAHTFILLTHAVTLSEIGGAHV